MSSKNRKYKRIIIINKKIKLKNIKITYKIKKIK